MLTETITWHEAVPQDLPDADMTVLVRTEHCAEPVWVGYFDGDTWRDTGGEVITVIRWADMPAGDAQPVASLALNATPVAYQKAADVSDNGQPLVWQFGVDGAPGWCECDEAHARRCAQQPGFRVRALRVVDGVPECETCNGVGTIDERLGGYSFSNPAAECPDCGGTGEGPAGVPGTQPAHHCPECGMAEGHWHRPTCSRPHGVPPSASEPFGAHTPGGKP